MTRGYQRGVVAAVPAAVFASAVAVPAGWPSPLEAPAETLMVWTPLPIAEFLLRHLGWVARPAALLGALAVVMFVCGVAGAVHALAGCGLWREVAGFLGAAAVLAIALVVLAPPSRPEPAWLLIVAFIPSLVFTRMRIARVSGRREFLERSAIILGGAAALVTVFSVSPVFSALATRRLFPMRREAGLRVAGISDLVTPAAQFYRMDKVLEIPTNDPPSWSLAFGGLVRTSLQVDFSSLIGNHSRVDRYVTCECVDNTVGGPMMSTALFSGVPIEALLKRAGAYGDTAVFHGLDGYAESTPLQILRSSGAILAYGMNGETLRREHGYPARLIVPGIYGFKSVKWLHAIEIVRGDYAGDWHAHGWTRDPVIRTTARIDVARREKDELLIAGMAFAGRRGIRAVEVRLNGGPWRRASLGRHLGGPTWVQWAVRLRGAGHGTVEARAIDGTGQIQTQARHDAYPSGATGWHRVTV